MASFFSTKIFTDLESNHYTIITKLDNVEIREFKNLIYASYIPPFGLLGGIANYLFVKKRINRIFDYRYEMLAKLFDD